MKRFLIILFTFFLLFAMNLNTVDGLSTTVPILAFADHGNSDCSAVKSSWQELLGIDLPNDMDLKFHNYYMVDNQFIKYSAFKVNEQISDVAENFLFNEHITQTAFIKQAWMSEQDTFQLIFENFIETMDNSVKLLEIAGTENLSKLRGEINIQPIPQQFKPNWIEPYKWGYHEKNIGTSGSLIDRSLRIFIPETNLLIIAGQRDYIRNLI